MCFSEYFYDQDEDDEAEPTFSEDEAVTQKGLRRSQSVKITRSRVRKDVSVQWCSGLYWRLSFLYTKLVFSCV